MSAQLFTALSTAALWDAVIRPWLAAASADLQATSPHFVITPTRGLAYFLKGRALEAGMHLLGVRFVGISEIRAELTEREPVTREQARLLLAAADAMIAPDPVLHALEQLATAGWSLADEAPAALRPIVHRYEQLLASARLRHVGQIDRSLLAAKDDTQFGRVLIAGFDGAHWPSFPLLASVVTRAEHATICLHDPRDEARELDELWIGTWENVFAPAHPCSIHDRPRPFADILRGSGSINEAARRAESPARAVAFLVGDTPHELAESIVRRALHDLAQPDCTRLGVVFAKAGVLSRLVALRLAEAGVPHQDALGHPVPGELEDGSWSAWLRAQEDRRVTPFAALLHTCPAFAQYCGGEAGELEETLFRAAGDLLIDDLAVLARFLATRKHDSLALALADGLRQFVWLPECTSLGEFLAQTHDAFTRLGWSHRAAELVRLSGWQKPIAQASVTRAAWLHWLAGTLISTRRERESAGVHPYARVQLLSYAQAEPQEWSHVIACDLNEGQWPPPWREDGWLAEPEMAALNARMRPLNRRAATQGRQGEGHVALRAGYTWMLTPGDERAVALRQFLNVLENTSVAVSAAACLRDAAEPGRSAQPSEYFTRLHFCARGRAASPQIMQALQAETVRWLARRPLPPRTEVTSTLRAWKARRDRDEAFGEYQFACRNAPPREITLAATAWENALERPAQAWLAVFLGLAEPQEPDADLVPAARGKWVHRWLATLAPRGSFTAIPPSDQIELRVREAAEAFRATASKLLADCGRELPDWWSSTWFDASGMASALARKLAGLTGWDRCAAEWSIENVVSPLPDGAALRLRGRMDFVVARGAGALGEEVWIIDHKTGDKKPLRLATFVTGDGLQLGLYALAASVLGAQKIGLSRLSPSQELTTPQLTEADLHSVTLLWQSLAAMQDRGAFGQVGELRNDYGIRAVYPLATLAIDPDILEAKWAHTHPALPRKADE